MTTPCAEFKENAWRKDLCVNCQRSKAEHSTPNVVPCATSSPIPTKRKSVIQVGQFATLERDRSKRGQSETGSDLQKSKDDCDWPENDSEWCVIDDNDQSKPEDIIKLKSGDILSSNKPERNSLPREDDSYKKGKSVLIRGDDSSRNRKSEIKGDDSTKNSKSELKGDDSSKKSKSEVRGKDSSKKSKSEIKEDDSSKKSKSEIKGDDSSKQSKNKNKMVLTKNKVNFTDTGHTVIGDDGGWDNFLEDIDDPSDGDSSSSEDISFTEEEREFVLQALENTMWNSDNNNLLQRTVDTVALRKRSSGEFEDLNKLSLWKADRFSTLRDCDKLLPSRYGTFPVRSKSSKSNLENMFDSDYKIPLTSDLQKDIQDLDIKLKSMSDKKRPTDAEINGQSMAFPYKVVSVEDIINPGNNAGPDLPAKAAIKSILDDSFGSSNFDEDLTDDTDLFASFKTDIDLDASTAGDDLVALLNNVLAKYSSDGDSFKGIEGHELLPDLSKDEVKQVVEAAEESDGKFGKGSIKSKEFEKKLVSLAKTFDLNKKKTKKAPRPPPSSPPPPEPITPKTSNPDNFPEPRFKMIPVGKSIIDHGLDSQERPLSPKRSTDFQLEASGDPTPNGKSPKADKSKKGISGFFKNFLKRGNTKDTIDSPPEESGSSASLNSGASSSPITTIQSPSSSSESVGQTENPSSPSTSKKETRSASPSLKLKVLPTKPPRSSIVLTASDADKISKSDTSPTNTTKSKIAKQSPELSKKISKKEKESPKLRRASIEKSPKINRKDSKTSDINEELKLKSVKEEIQQKTAFDTQGTDHLVTVQRQGSDKIVPTVPIKPPVATRVKPTILPAKPSGLSQSAKLSSNTLPTSSKSSLSQSAGSSSSSSTLPTSVSSLGSSTSQSSSHQSEDNKESVKERTGSISSQDGAKTSEEKSTDAPRSRAASKDSSQQLRKRPKSPKRTAAPNRPQQPPKVVDGKNLFTKELEKKIIKNLENKPHPQAPPPGPPPAPPTGVSSPQNSSKTSLSSKDSKKTAPNPPSSPTSPTDSAMTNPMTMSFSAVTTSGCMSSSSLTGPMSVSFTGSSIMETRNELADTTDSASHSEKIELPNKAQGQNSFIITFYELQIILLHYECRLVTNNSYNFLLFKEYWYQKSLLVKFFFYL